MTSQTKKLISNLKKEIDELKEKLENLYPTRKDNQKNQWYYKYRYEKEYRQAQLQLAEKLMKLRDKEEKERLNKLIEKIKKDIKKIWGWNWSPLVKDGVDAVMVELNKILNEALEKCQN